MPEFKLSGLKHRLLKHPQLVYCAACLSLDGLWVLIQISLIRQYPTDVQGFVGQHVIDVFSFGAMQPQFMGVMGVATVLYVMTVAGFNRVQGIRVQDALAWKNIDSKVPTQHKLVMQNTDLVKRALGLSNVAVVTWRAPTHAEGHGVGSLSIGTTFISPGPIHDASLENLPADASLRDFWRVAIHPEDYADFIQAFDAVLAGRSDTFSSCPVRRCRSALAPALKWPMKASAYPRTMPANCFRRLPGQTMSRGYWRPVTKGQRDCANG